MINYDFSWWEDILLSWRFKPWSPEYGTDQENHETNRCSWYRYFKGGGEYPPSPNNRICIATLWTGFPVPLHFLHFLSSSSHYQFPVILLSLPISCSLNFQCCGFIDFLSWNFGKITRNKNIRSIFLYIYGFFLS